MVKFKIYARGLRILITNGKRLYFFNDCSSIDQINRKEECPFNENWFHTVINYGLLIINTVRLALFY